MKKRSLVSAIAMLVVSAIVLTSSTYAWFSTSSSSSVAAINASVNNNAGSLRIAATGDNAATASAGIYKTEITATDYTNLAEALRPVSMSINGADTPQFNKVAYDAAKFDTFAAATANTEYLTYQFTAEYVNGTAAAKTINITPTFTPNAKLFTYGLLSITADGVTTNYFFNGSSGYTPVAAMTADEVLDTNGNAIIDAEDTGYAASDMGSYASATVATSGSAMTLMSVDAGTTETAIINVYVWAEGNDPQCTGNVNAESSGFAFGLAEAA